MSADQSIGGSKETAPLTVSDIAQLKRYIFSRENFFGELFGVLVIVAMVIMAEAPPILERKANLLDGLFLLFFIILFFFRGYTSIRNIRQRRLLNASIRADLASGVKIVEILEIGEALCIQEFQHRGLAYSCRRIVGLSKYRHFGDCPQLGYFCRTTDGRVFFILDRLSAFFYPEVLAEGYRCGVDPRHERFVPLQTLEIWWTPHSKFVFAEKFSGEPAPLVDGIYEGDFPESEPEFSRAIQVHKTWDEIMNSYRRDSYRVNWSDAITSVDKQ